MKLPRLNSSIPIADDKGRPASAFQTFFQKFAQTIEAQETAQDNTLNRIRRMLSHTVPTTILHARDDGATATITIDAHTRVYADATTLAVGGGSVSGLTSGTTYAGYYDDTTLVNPGPTYHFTTTLASAQSAVADGRHFLGIITTPAAGSGLTVDGGGVYAAGSNVGGELV